MILERDESKSLSGVPPQPPVRLCSSDNFDDFSTVCKIHGVHSRTVYSPEVILESFGLPG